MSNIEIGLYSIVVILILVQTGLHVAIALALVSFVGVVLVRGNVDIAGHFLAQAALDSVARYSFGVIPLFVLMGMLVSVSGLGRDIFRVAGQIFRRVTGGLGLATVFANAAFAAVNGTSIASASVFTRVAVPELLRHGFTPRFAVGVVAGSSVLGMLIPPSLLLILFGILAEVSIGTLFTAGIVPGLVLALLFGLTIRLLIRFCPGFVGSTRPDTEMDLMPASALVVKSLPILVLMVVVLGGIYGGVFTPTEAGGVGAMAAAIIAFWKHRFSWGEIRDILLETGRVTASITFLLIAAHMYSRLLALTGLPNAMAGLIDTYDLGLTVILLGYLLVVILLGTILDSASIMLILLPLILPVMVGLDVNLIWFGILTIIAIEVGLLTPPLGVACFVIKSNLDDDRISISDIFIGAAPFAAAMVVMILIVLVFPGIVTFIL